MTASALAVATALAGGANAADYTLTSSNSPYQVDTGSSNTITVTSGTYAYFNGDMSGLPSGALGLYWSNGNISALSYSSMGGSTGADTIIVEDGATIEFGTAWSWQAFQSMFQVAGDAIFDSQIPWGIHLLGTNSFTGDITVNAGTVVYFGESWSSTVLTLGEDTDIYLGGMGTYYGATIKLYGSSSVTNTINTISSADSAAVFNLYGSTLILDGANTASSSFYGTFNVTTGATLMIGDENSADAVFGDVNGSTAVINITGSSGSLGVLSGYGTIYGTVNNSGGIVKPGGTDGVLGTLTINGDYNQSSGQTKVEIAADGTNSALVVNGTATFTGGSLVIVVDDGEYSTGVYTVVQATSLTGVDSLTVSTSGSASGVIVATTYDDTSISLVTEKSTGAQVVGHTVLANRTNLYEFAHSLYDVIEMGSPESGTKIAAKDGYVSLWGAPFYRLDNIGRDGAGYDNRTAGMTAGVEYRTPWHNGTVGVALSVSNSWMDVKNETITASTDAYNIALYGGADLQNARVDGMLFYNGFDSTTQRTIEGYGVSKGRPEGWAWGASVQISRSLFEDLVTPYIRGIYARVHQNAFAESGIDDLDLAYGRIAESTFVGDVGLKVHLLKPTPDLKAKLELTLAVQHDFSDPGEEISGGFANLEGSSFTYTWDGNSANAVLLGVNFADEVMDGLEVFGRLNGTFTTNQRAGELQVGAKYRF